MSDAEDHGRASAATGGLPIGAVSRLVGIPVETIRTWERRHGAVSPARTPGGTRLYPPEQVERLRLLGRAVRAGLPVSRVARLAEPELRALLRSAEEPAPARWTAPASLLGGLVDDYLARVADFDFAAAAALLQRAEASLTPKDLVFGLVLPAVRGLGDGWARGELGIAQEHAASRQLQRSLEDALARSASNHLGEPIVLGTVSGHRMVFGVLAGALTCTWAGRRVTCLGADLPVAELVAACRSVGSRVLLLSAVRGPEAALAPALEGLPSELEIWVGLDADHPEGEALEQRGCVLLSSYEALEARLQEA